MWHDLSDDELQARLTQRGVTDDRARFLVEHRDAPAEVAMIQGVLDGTG